MRTWGKLKPFCRGSLCASDKQLRVSHAVIVLINASCSALDSKNVGSARFRLRRNVPSKMKESVSSPGFERLLLCNIIIPTVIQNIDAVMAAASLLIMEVDQVGFGMGNV